MRLVNYGAGEITDRLTILSLKIAFAVEAGRDVTAFQTERTALLTQIRSRTLNGKWFDAVLDLGTVNAMLWHAEDDLRALRGDDQAGWETAAAALAFRIQVLNDKRADLVERINKDTGEAQGREKVDSRTVGEGQV